MLVSSKEMIHLSNNYFFCLGQTNYGWANSVCERVAEERVKAGLPGVAIQWGGVGEVGVLADTLGDIEASSALLHVQCQVCQVHWVFINKSICIFVKI